MVKHIHGLVQFDSIFHLTIFQILTPALLFDTIEKLLASLEIGAVNSAVTYFSFTCVQSQREVKLCQMSLCQGQLPHDKIWG